MSPRLFQTKRNLLMITSTLFVPALFVLGGCSDQNASMPTDITLSVLAAGNVLVDTTVPTVKLVSSVRTVVTASSLKLTATAHDNVGVSRVEFYDGASLLSTDTSRPYTSSVALSSANNGTRRYSARAFDAAGNTKTSNTVNVTVNIPAIPGDSLLPSGAGRATYYDKNLVNHCSYEQWPDNYVALNTPDYNNAALCGAYMEVTNSGGKTVTVQVVDECPDAGCIKGTIDLNKTSMEQLSVPGVLLLERVSWKVVRGNVNGPLHFRFRADSNGSFQYWGAVQVSNHAYPVSKLELKGADGTFSPLPRESYNYFIAASGFGTSSFGTGALTFRITDLLGHVVVQENVNPLSNTDIVGTQQFP
jgi:expansin (peptidoglycan-binding protein)